MSEQTPADPNGPLMTAWKSYQETADYLNTLSWATKPQHTEGSLWAAFARGFAMATLRPRVGSGTDSSQRSELLNGQERSAILSPAPDGTLTGIPIEVREDFPKDAIGFEQGGKLVGGITNLAPDGTTRSTRERILEAARLAGYAKWRHYNELDEGDRTITLTAAREALLIAKERLGQRFTRITPHTTVAVNDELDHLLADLSAPSEDDK